MAQRTISDKNDFFSPNKNVLCMYDPTHAQPCQRMKQQHVFFDGDIRVILRRIFCLKYKKAQTCVRRCHQRFSLCLTGVYLAAFPSAIFARSVLARFQHQTHSISSEKSKNFTLLRFTRIIPIVKKSLPSGFSTSWTKTHVNFLSN